ncbi:MAG: transglutaminase-like domain-containing protein [Eubacterium sp.]|nr:transglutaminase-like domain-containing protein [Eubacterium sp.]
MGKKKKNTPILLTYGIEYSQREGVNTEKRILTLLLKGLMVYMVVMGQTGCLLSSLGVSYNVLMVNLFILAGSLFCSLLYYSKLWENLGYILLFVFMLFVAIQLRNYISSGFFAVVNNMAEKAAVFFGTEVIQGFKERLPNRYLTITISSIYVGWVNAILFNVIISRRMKYMVATVLSVLVLLIPFYLEKEPDLFYSVMLIAGIILTWIMRGGEHFDITPDNNRYIVKNRPVGFRKKRTYINYIYDFGSHIKTVGAVVAGVLVVTVIFGIISPQSQYASVRKTSAWKEETKETFENLYKLGIWGIFNMYPNTGGLSSGVLGGVNSVQLDYETDLKVTLVPYDTKRIYLRSFTGAWYWPFENRWLRDMTGEVPKPESTSSLTGRVLKDIFEKNNNKEKSSKAKIEVENTGAAIGVYLPYYMDSKEGASEYTIQPNQKKEMEYYPLLDESETAKKYSESLDEDKKISGKENKKNKSKKKDKNKEKVSANLEDSLSVKREKEDVSERAWLAVPDDNKEAVRKFCEEAGLKKNSASVEETVKKLSDYYQKEIPYSYQPGLTPYDKDFVNYFLTENRKGYCAHFASAAVLIFRNLGIPARYVEGYVIDPSDIASDGTLKYDKNSKEYYEGYNPLNNKEVVEVEVSDAAAHAWLEVYDKSRGGWVIADVTPYSTEASPGVGFLAGLLRLLSGDDSNAADSDASDAAGITDDLPAGETIMKGANSVGMAAGAIVLSVIALIFIIRLIRFIVRRISYAVRYSRADRSGKLVMEFEKYSRRYKHISPEGTSYQKRIAAIREDEKSTLTEAEGAYLADEMEKAAFSGQEVDKETYEAVHRMIK